MSTAIVYTEFGGPEVLTVADVEVPAPGPGEVTVRIEAVGVNPIDHKLRSGLRASDPIVEPRRLGSDAAGIVTAVGSEVEGFRVGDPVVVFGAAGTYASALTTSAAHVSPRPPQVSAAEGATCSLLMRSTR